MKVTFDQSDLLWRVPRPLGSGAAGLADLAVKRREGRNHQRFSPAHHIIVTSSNSSLVGASGPFAPNMQAFEPPAAISEAASAHLARDEEQLCSVSITSRPHDPGIWDMFPQTPHMKSPMKAEDENRLRSEERIAL